MKGATGGPYDTLPAVTNLPRHPETAHIISEGMC
jgi:hypothetical protein